MISPLEPASAGFHEHAIMANPPDFPSLVVAATLLIAAGLVEAKAHRSAAVKAEFQREHPCPSTGRTKGACPDYVKDHVKPLDCGGADDPSNMQWQTTADAKAKDRVERRNCRR